MTHVSLNLDVARVSRWLVFCSVAVLLLGFFREAYVAQFGLNTALKDLRQIALDTEHCLGSFYSSALMGLSALAITAVAQRDAERWRRVRWSVLAVIFVVMSIDETVSFHEVLIEPLRPAFSFSSYLHFAWIVPGALFVLAVGLAYLPFVFALPARTRNRIILAGLLYVGGALGLEAVGGHFHAQGGFDHPLYTAAFLAEETLEIAGLTLFATTLLDMLRSATAEAPARAGRERARAPATAQATPV